MSEKNKNKIKLKKNKIKYISFRDWKIKNKILFSFFIVSLIYGLFGLFVINFNAKNFNKDSLNLHIIHNIIIQQKDAELFLINYYLVDDINNLPVENLDNTEKELYKNINEYINSNTSLVGNSIISNLKSQTETFFILGNDFIKLHNKKLLVQKEFNEIYTQEKIIRNSFEKDIIKSNDVFILSSYYKMLYEGNEFLFQYKDSSHRNKWLKAVDNFLDINKDRGLIKQEIIEEYRFVVVKLANLTLRKELMDIDEIEKLNSIKILENAMSDLQGRIDDISRDNLEKFKKNMLFFAFMFMLLSFFIIGTLGFIVATFISNPIKKVSNYAMAISNGKLRKIEYIDSNDEIGKTVKALNFMLNRLLKGKKRLAKKVKELEKFNDLAIDRELKMIEIKIELENYRKKDIQKKVRNKTGADVLQNCWEFWNCKKEIREKCPSYISNLGKECWLVSSGKCPRSKERGFEDCIKCAWYKKVNSIKESVSKKIKKQ